MNLIKNVSNILIIDETGERIFDSNQVITRILSPIDVTDKPAACYHYYDFDNWRCKNYNNCKCCYGKFFILNFFICCL